jgi:hypothetical protein
VDGPSAGAPDLIQFLPHRSRPAARLAEANHLPDYGVLVASDPTGGFVVVVDDRSPERLYGVEHCGYPVRGPR